MHTFIKVPLAKLRQLYSSKCFASFLCLYTRLWLWQYWWWHWYCCYCWNVHGSESTVAWETTPDDLKKNQECTLISGILSNPFPCALLLHEWYTSSGFFLSPFLSMHYYLHSSMILYMHSKSAFTYSSKIEKGAFHETTPAFVKILYVSATLQLLRPKKLNVNKLLITEVKPERKYQKRDSFEKHGYLIVAIFLN